MDNATAFVLAAVIGGLLGNAVTQLLSYFFGSKKTIAESHRDKRIEVYTEILAMLLLAAKHITESTFNRDSQKPPSDMLVRWSKITQGLMQWGSPEVIQKWKVFRNSSGTVAARLITVDEFKFVIDDLLREIRHDLGNSNKGLARGDLVDLFMSDGENPPGK